MKLLNLKIRNFRGIESLDVNADGQSINVIGDNGLGKTTIGDAITWLLFDKDTQGRTPEAFDIKTRKNGEPQHELDHEVEAKFDEVTLRKVYREKWVQPRGKIDKRLDGHKTDHFVDGLEVSKSDYNGRVAEIMSDEMFRLVTGPHYFADQVHWSKRAELLSYMIGELSDSDIEAIDPQLSMSEYREVLGRDSHSEAKERLRQSQKKLVSRATNEIDAQVKERQGMIQGVEIDKDLDKKIARHKELSDFMKSLRVKKEKALELHWGQLQSDRLKSMDDLMEATAAASRESAKIDSAKRRAEEIRGEIESLKRLIAESNDIVKSLDKELSAPIDGGCVTCGQDLSGASDEYIETHKKAVSRRRGILLVEISEAGESLASLQTELKTTEKSIKSRQKSLEKLQSERASAEQRAEKLQEAMKSLPESKAAKSIEKDMAEVEAELSELDYDSLSEQRMRRSMVEDSKKRIDDLLAERKAIQGELEDIEHSLDVLESKESASRRAMAEKVNAMFDRVEWVVMERQLNGSINYDVCYPKWDGKPFSSLSRSEKTKAGLEIISVISRHFGKSAPVIIDDAEGITRMPDSGDLQLICMYARKGVDQITIESN